MRKTKPQSSYPSEVTVVFNDATVILKSQISSIDELIERALDAVGETTKNVRKSTPGACYQ